MANANKETVVTKVVAAKGITKKDATEYLDVVLNAIIDTVDELEGGDKLGLPGFGKFTKKAKAAGKGLNPKLLKELKDAGVPEAEAKERATVDTEPSKGVGFSAAKAFKDILNG